MANADIQQVLWGAEECGAIESAAMDMNTAFGLGVIVPYFLANVVCDLFDVVAKFGREVISRVSVDNAIALRDNPKSRQIIKRSCCLLLPNP
ncbi:hypothetical protein [Pantoea ananatis]|uniref:hypothetical protein n=1 Tax=Pantoea ananas TaxID=553 RepID=UPI000DDBBF18|nr:hypothetical protein [Pantoea ananatis]